MYKNEINLDDSFDDSKKEDFFSVDALKATKK